MSEKMTKADLIRLHEGLTTVCWKMSLPAISSSWTMLDGIAYPFGKKIRPRRDDTARRARARTEADRRRARVLVRGGR